MIEPRLLKAKVMHRRLAPKKNEFSYDVFYLCLPLKEIENGSLAKTMAVNRPGLVSFHAKDHGDRKGGSLEQWIRKALDEHMPGVKAEDICLLCMPRILGYVFNPASFWFCFDGDGNLTAVLVEVNNTFGETHSYICAHEDGRPIDRADWFEAAKDFFVSPFLERKGNYRFKFVVTEEKMAVRIDYFENAEGKQEPILETSVAGTLEPLSKKALRTSLLQRPLMTLKVIFLIHWQAVRLLVKGVKRLKKPEQLNYRLTRASRLRAS